MSTLDIDNACSTSRNEPLGTTSLAAASCNLGNLDQAVNSTAATWTDRTGGTRDTIQGVLDKLGVIYDNPVRDWSPSLVVSDLRAHRYPASTGDIYIPTRPTPFTTGGTFNTDDWVLLNGYSEAQISSNIIRDLSQAYEFSTLDNAINSIISFPIGKVLHLKERTTGNGGGAVWDVVDVGTVTPNGIDIVASSSLPLAFVMRDVENTIAVSTVASLKSTDLIPRQTAKTQGYYDGWSEAAEQNGSSNYVISTLQDVRDAFVDPVWVPDEIQDHTLDNGYIAMMFRVPEYSLDQFGVVGSADDTSRLQSAFRNTGTIHFNPKKTYVSTNRLKLLDGTTVNLNGARVNFECVGNVENFVMGSRTRLHNGIVDSTGNDPDGTSSTRGGRCVRVAGKSSNPDGSDPELIHDWVIENLRLFPGVVFGNGEVRGARGIIIRDNVTNGRISNIYMDCGGIAQGGVYAEWGETEWYTDPGIFSVHPRNVLVENITVRNAGQTGTSSSPTVGCSGCYNFTFTNIDIEGPVVNSVTSVGMIASIGEAGVAYATERDRRRILTGITFTDCNVIGFDTPMQLIGRSTTGDQIPRGVATFNNCTLRGNRGVTGALANRDGVFMTAFAYATFNDCTVKDCTRYGYYPISGNINLRIIGGNISFNEDVGVFFIGDSSTIGTTNQSSNGEVDGVLFEGNCQDATITRPCGVQTGYTNNLIITNCKFIHGGTQDICVNAADSVNARYVIITHNNAFDPAITRMWRTSRAATTPNDELYRILVHNNFFDSATCSIEGTHVLTTDGL